MDWLEFTSSMTGYLAWPSALAFAVWTLKKPLRELLKRMIAVEMWGSKAEFGKSLSETIEVAELVPRPTAPKSQKRMKRPPPRASDDYLKLSETHPSAAVIEAYKKVEAVLDSWSDASGMTHPPSNEYLVKWLVDDDLLSKETQELYRKVVATRKIAVHAPAGAITVGEALAFRDLCNRLAVYLEDALREFNKKRAKG